MIYCKCTVCSFVRTTTRRRTIRRYSLFTLTTVHVYVYVYVYTYFRKYSESSKVEYLPSYEYVYKLYNYNVQYSGVHVQYLYSCTRTRTCTRTRSASLGDQNKRKHSVCPRLHHRRNCSCHTSVILWRRVQGAILESKT